MHVFLFTLSVLLMIVLPAVLAAGWRRRTAAPWWLFGAGVLTFTSAQVVHLPLNSLLGRLGLLPPLAGEVDNATLIQAAVALGLTAGLTEELARAVGYWLIGRRGSQTAPTTAKGVMLGLGHGGVEAMVFGGVLTAAGFTGLWALQGTDLNSLELEAGQLAALQQQLKLVSGALWLAFVPLLERVLAMAFQVTLSLLVLQAFRRRHAAFVLLAIGYHALVDAVAVAAAQRLESALAVEGLFLVAITPGVVWAWRLVRREQAAARHVANVTYREEWRLFLAATTKELKQQWRTRRVLVVVAVFALFGLTSPLLARFTPELLRSIEGAEAFAELIPEPTAADALGQYIKNLTQFGFILALLLGMGAVAGEKEKGTAAMFLSKPLPRWAFITSKFMAQAAVYTLAFVVAAVGAAIYTLVLFDELDVAAFLVINGLLLLWLLPFVGVTLVGSTVGKTTGMAAGIGLAGCVLLLLAGSLPAVGTLAPGALVGWAGQLALGEGAAANGGALAMGVVLVVLSLVTAVAVFEVQEL